MIVVHVQRRGRGNFSLWWIGEDGKREEEFIRGIGEQEAWKRAGAKEYQLNYAPQETARDTTWRDFRLQFSRVYLSDAKPKTFRAYVTALNSIERILQPVHLTDITTASLLAYAANADISRSSVVSYLSHLQVALNWAKKVELIESVPEIEFPKVKEVSKGRPISVAEFSKMIEVAKEVRMKEGDAEKWIRLMEGIWFTGLRISEAVTIEWESQTAGISLDKFHDGYVIIYREHKRGKPVTLPVMPDCVEWIDKEFTGERNGRVFGLDVRPDWAVKIITRIGEKADILVSATSRRGGGPKFASAHDLRRSFAARWAEVLPESILAAIMRHRSPETTRKHYAIIDAKRILHAVEEATKRRGG